MRISNNRALFVLALLKAGFLEAFVPGTFQNAAAVQRCLPLSVALSTSNESDYLELHADKKTLDPSFLYELTDSILESEQPELLAEDTLDNIFPLLLLWGRKESKEGAKMVEKILEHLEKAISEGNELLTLSNKHYTVAVDAWGKSGDEDAAQNAERILERMEEKGKVDESMAPTRATYNAVMNAYSKQGDTKRTAELLEFMKTSSDFEPTTKDYNVLLGAHAKVGEARRAENVLKKMVDQCKQLGNQCECAPDLYSYNMLLDAWAKSNEKGRGQRAEDILSTLEKNFDNGQFEWKPDARSYSSAICAIVRSNEANVIERAENMLAQAESRGIVEDNYLHSALLDAYASSTSPGAAERAERLLDKLEKEGTASAVSYNTVIKAWKSSEAEDGPARAEAIVRRMEDRKLVDAFSYCTLIAAYANKGDRASAERAEEILDDMEKVGATPNCYTLNAVMNAWIRCGELQRAEQILERMEKAFYEGSFAVVPNVVSYTTVMNGWAKSKQASAVEKTEEIFQRMVSSYEAGNEEARPNLFSLVTLINSITKSGRKGAAERAENILFEMYEEFKNGKIGVKPDTQLVSSVIDCWQKSGDRDAGERAEALLNWLIHIYEETGDEELRPNQFSFTSAIAAWAKTRKFGKAIRARAILSRMLKMHKSGAITATPNTHCYTAVINSCAYCENDALEKRGALQIAVETYKELLNSDYGRPNQVTFSTVITALRNLSPVSEKRAEAIQNVFRRCAQDGQVAEFVLLRLQSALNADQLREVVGDAALSSDGSVDIDQIPDEWKRNARTKSSRNKRGKQGLVTQMA